MKRLMTLVVAALFAFGAVVAVRMLPWWALALGLVAVVMLGKFFIGRIIRNLFLMPFRAKGAVLKGATAVVHRISPTSPTESEEAPVGARDHYMVEVTITPNAPEGPFGMWEPGELRLVRPESVMRPESGDHDDEDHACEILGIEIRDAGQWTEDEGMKYDGAQQLRLHVAVQAGVKELKFRYYFEEFGNILLTHQAMAAHR